jgi:DNA polymerase
MGALEMGVAEEELQPLVTAWRQSNPNIVRLWWDVDSAALQAVRERTATETHGIRFAYQSGMLFIALPSGRRLAYVKPRIGQNQFGSDCVTYEGVGGTKKWERLNSHSHYRRRNVPKSTGSQSETSRSLQSGGRLEDNSAHLKNCLRRLRKEV